MGRSALRSNKDIDIGGGGYIVLQDQFSHAGATILNRAYKSENMLLVEVAEVHSESAELVVNFEKEKTNDDSFRKISCME